jgi:hypothetical protein
MLNLGPSPLYSRRDIAADSPRNILLYSLWVGGVVLSQGDETHRLFEFLRRTFLSTRARPFKPLTTGRPELPKASPLL